MKSVITIKNSILLLILSLAFSCETEKILFTGPYHVRFTNESITKKESFPDPIKIEVHIVGPVQSEDITINYAISGSAREGIDYSITGDENKLTIKKGEYVGYIEVQLIDNANNILRSQDLVFTLLSVSKAGLEVGQGPSAIGKSFTLTIQDDCILAGIYSGTQNVFDIPIEGITITSSDCENYLLSNWNINAFSPPYDYSLTFVDNGDNTITIPVQDTDTALKGKGIVDPLTGKITMTIVLTDNNNQELVITLTPN
jgi:hypothetical protein